MDSDTLDRSKLQKKYIELALATCLKQGKGSFFSC